MNQFLKTLLLFIAFAIVAYLLFIWIAGNNAPMYLRKNLSYRAGAYGHMNSRMKDVKKIQNVDILFLGSSHAYRGFDTRIFKKQGIKCFNLGSSSQTPVQTLMLLEKYLGKLNPDLIIFEVYPEIFGLDGVESSLDIVANEVIDFNLLKMALKINHVKTYNALSYSWMRQLYGNWGDFQEAAITENDTYISGGGFVEHRKSYHNKEIHQPVELKIDKFQWKEFEITIELINKRKCSLLLVQAPVTRSFYNSIQNNESIDKMLSKQGNYINFNLLMNLNDSLHFYDSDHLNQDGVELFNNELISLIKKKKLLDLKE